MSTRRLTLIVVLAASLTSGCGSSTATIRGKVRYKDAAVKSGQINFIGEGGKSRSSTISKDGSYEITDGPVGPVTVTVVSTEVVSKPGKAAPAVSAVGGTVTKGAPAAPITYTVSAVPTKYNEAHTSGLKFTISGGSQRIDIDLKN